MKYDVTVFTPCSFKTGQKIRLEGGRRHGDWEVAAVGDHTVTLKCPVSKKEYEWPLFCYFTEEKKEEEWPRAS